MDISIVLKSKSIYYWTNLLVYISGLIGTVHSDVACTQLVNMIKTNLSENAQMKNFQQSNEYARSLKYFTLFVWYSVLLTMAFKYMPLA